MAVDIGQLRLVVDAETKGVERAMVRVQQNLKATETALTAMGKGQEGDAKRAAALEQAMVSLARKGLDENHQAIQRLVGAHNQIQREMEESAKAAKLAETRQRDYAAATRASQMVLAGLAAAATGAAAATVKAIGVYSQYEQAEIAFKTMLGGAQQAQAFLEEMWDFAKKTPFTYEGVQQSAKQLLAYGFTAEKIPDLLMAIGDAAAGLGGGSETIDRITRALGQKASRPRKNRANTVNPKEKGGIIIHGDSVGIAA